jgi:hypothetical protein
MTKATKVQLARQVNQSSNKMSMHSSLGNESEFRQTRQFDQFRLSESDHFPSRLMILENQSLTLASP